MATHASNQAAKEQNGIAKAAPRGVDSPSISWHGELQGKATVMLRTNRASSLLLGAIGFTCACGCSVSMTPPSIGVTMPSIGITTPAVADRPSRPAPAADVQLDQLVAPI